MMNKTQIFNGSGDKMYKISSQVIDYYDDERMVLEFADDMPDYVKTSSLVDYDEMDSILDDDYAVIMITKTGSKIKRYPVFDKPHTLLSCQAFLKTAGKLPASAIEVAATSLFSSCLYHNIECPDMISKMASDISSNTVYVDEGKDNPFEYHLNVELMKKQASNISDDEYGVVVGDKRMYPLNNKTNVELAIGYFEKNSKVLIPDIKHQFATNICKSASRFDIDVPNSISIYTNEEKGNRIGLNIKRRRIFAKTAEHREFLDTLQSKFMDMGKDEIIDYLSEFDKIAELSRHWGLELNDPYVSVLEKSAENFFEDGDNLGSIKSPAGKGSNVKSKDITAYANGSASVELLSRLPDDIVNGFLTEPLDTYKDMPDIQKKVIIDGVLGKL